jgi:hypothetical protein
MTLLGTAIEWDSLLEVVWTAAAAGVGVTVAFALALFGATRAVDLGRDGRPVEAGLYGIVGAVAIVAVAASVVLAIIVMTSK